MWTPSPLWLSLFIVSAGNVRMEPQKGNAILDQSQPASVKQVQQFFGFVHFSPLASPLNTLTPSFSLIC